MHSLLDIVYRTPVPEPWAEGEKIPWNEPAFSARMLKEHLSQEHDAASRRAAKIDAHVRWIHSHVLCGRPAKILDLGCGPGLYSARLAGLGHTCVGIDFAPASIAYAQETARVGNLDCTYHLEDVRKAPYGAGFDLAMFIFGEFNVFRPEDAKKILEKMYNALNDGGVVLLEPHTFEMVRQIGTQGSSWYSSPSGLFSDRPHLRLTETFWNEKQAVAVERHLIVDAATGQVARYADAVQAYTDDQYRALLADCGLSDIVFHPSLAGTDGEAQPGLFAITAHKAKNA